MKLHFISVMGAHFDKFHFFENKLFLISSLIYGSYPHFGLERSQLYGYILNRREFWRIKLISWGLYWRSDFFSPEDIFGLFVHFWNVDFFESIILNLRNVNVSKFSLLRSSVNRPIFRIFWRGLFHVKWLFLDALELLNRLLRIAEPWGLRGLAHADILLAVFLISFFKPDALLRNMHSFPSFIYSLSAHCSFH